MELLRGMKRKRRETDDENYYAWMQRSNGSDNFKDCKSNFLHNSIPILRENSGMDILIHGLIRGIKFDIRTLRVTESKEQMTVFLTTMELKMSLLNFIKE